MLVYQRLISSMSKTMTCLSNQGVKTSWKTSLSKLNFRLHHLDWNVGPNGVGKRKLSAPHIFQPSTCRNGDVVSQLRSSWSLVWKMVQPKNMLIAVEAFIWVSPSSSKNFPLKTGKMSVEWKLLVPLFLQSFQYQASVISRPYNVCVYSDSDIM